MASSRRPTPGGRVRPEKTVTLSADILAELDAAASQQRYRRWTPEEDAIVTVGYGKGLTSTAIAGVLQKRYTGPGRPRKPGDVSNRIRTLGLSLRQP